MLLITLMTKCLIQRKRSTNTVKELSEAEQGTTGTSTGRRTPRSPRSPGSAERTPSRRQELSSSRVSKRKSKEEARVSTQLELNKYNTNYEALRLADSTALAFNLGKILSKLLLQVDELPYPSYIVINHN